MQYPREKYSEEDAERVLQNIKLQIEAESQFSLKESLQ
jgi:hypothetical protein